VARAKSTIGELNRALRKWAPKTVFMEDVTKIVFPLFLYAIEVWFPPTMKEKQRLERMIKFAARLALNDFSSNVTYLQLLEKLKWKSVSQMVMERRLLTLKKYLDGTRHIPSYVFPAAILTTSRFSQRLRAQCDRESILLASFTSQRNRLEEKLSTVQMRLLWNSLSEELVHLPFQKFKEEILKDRMYQSLCDRRLIDCVL
jgi:hypothetical protein